MMATEERPMEQDVYATPAAAFSVTPPAYTPVPDPGPIELLLRCVLDGTYKPEYALMIARGYDERRGRR